jgi:hypothetical protein
MLYWVQPRDLSMARPSALPGLLGMTDGRPCGSLRTAVLAVAQRMGAGR